MNAKLVETVANAVLYEGYTLYPYRPSAIKNKQRWNFGVLYPRTYSEAQKGSDAWFMQTQCLLRTGGQATVNGIDIKVRFLQASLRQIGRLLQPVSTVGGHEPEFEPVEMLEVGARGLRSWQEALERDVILPPVRVGDVLGDPVRQRFGFSSSREFELVKDDAGAVAGLIVRTRERVEGSVDVSAEKCGDDLFRITVVIANQTNLDAAESVGREAMLFKSLLSVHTVLSCTGGEFLSLMDPPAARQQAASDCRNIGTWPVLIGEDNATDAMLSSPIILYDYPQIAPESPGDLFDGTEIDEILALRILTLSDDEKREIRRADDRSREVLERTENLPAEQFLKLHGVLRGMKHSRANGSGADREDER